MKFNQCLLTLILGLMIETGAWAQPKRIVSMSLASDEILIQLLSPGELSRLAALSPLAFDQSYSYLDNKTLATVPVLKGGVEALAALQPDLVILASFNQPAFLDYVEKRRWKYLLLERFNTLQDIATHITRIAEAVAATEKGREIYEQYIKELQRLQTTYGLKHDDQTPPTRVLILDSGFTTMGRDTLFTDIVKTLGATNLALEWKIENWAKVSLEKVLASPPDLFILPARTEKHEQEFAWFWESPLSRALGKSLSKKVCFIPARSLFSTSTQILHGIERLGECLQKRLPSAKKD